MVGIFVRVWMQIIFITGRNEVLAKVIFSQACVKNSVHRGGGVCSKFSGGVSAPNFQGGCLLQIFRGVSAPNFRGWGGVCSKFSGGGGCLLQIFRGGCLLQIFGGGVSNFGIRSMFGRYASYWNAFLFLLFSVLRDGQSFHTCCTEEPKATRYSESM